MMRSCLVKPDAEPSKKIKDEKPRSCYETSCSYEEKILPSQSGSLETIIYLVYTYPSKKLLQLEKSTNR